MSKEEQEKRYRSFWEKKTYHQIQNEVDSMHKYMNKHNSAYHWHGANSTSPDEMADGDRMLVLRELLSKKLKEKPA
jgi:hypothetical protein